MRFGWSANRAAAAASSGARASRDGQPRTVEKPRPNNAPMTPGRVFLKKGREGPVRGGNPWVFSQAIDRVEPAAIEPGARVWILDNAGATLGHGYYNTATTIAVRMLALGGEPGPAEIVRWRLERALKLREWVIGPGTDCCRMLNG